jgi:hypothetical protein
MKSMFAEHSAGKFAKKLLGEMEIKAVLRRLDRLTQEETWMMGVQMLEVVHSLVNNVKVVMDGTKCIFACWASTELWCT